MRLIAEMRRRHHGPQRRLDRAPRIGQEVGNPREGLVCFGIKDVQDGTDEQRVTGLLPMVPALESPFWIDQDVGDVLDVPHLLVAASDLEQRVIGRASLDWSGRTAGRGQTESAIRR